ncbi:cytochrome P450 [Penicillium frequentans]|uniref:Cytochrome P450 n=1 Tax=Penicillium frequentans TaxID=3151616 RepID=A0AAD6CX28_9EURO|nr:cytochrome P450 [Penicillium glabrum]
MGLLTQAFLFLRENWIFLILAPIAFHLLYNKYGHGLSKIPGPFWASTSDIWLLVHYTRRRGLTERQMHEKYNSPLLRLGPNTVSVSDPEAIRVIYGWKPVFKKSRLYISQQVTTEHGNVLGTLSSTRDEDWHSKLRRPVANAYALSTLVEYEPLVDSTTRTFVREVTERFVKTGEECPLSDWLQMYAFDIIGELTFSKRFGFLESGKDLNNMMYHTGRAMDYIGVIGQIPMLDEYLRLKGFGHILRKLRKTNAQMKFTVAQIGEHITSKDKSRPDFLSRFLQAREKYPGIMTDGQLAMYTNTNVGAGSDTTAIALREIIYRLLTHPGSKQRFMSELRTVLQERNAEDADLPVTWAESHKMPYFQDFVRECLRLCPALGQIIPRDVPEGGLTLCGQYLPEGTVVGCNAWTVHRDEEVFGPGASEFRPERWAEASLEKRRNMDNSFFTFGGGPRVCIGKNIAMLEINKFVPEIFRRFEVEIVDPNRYHRLPGWLVVQKGLDVVLKERKMGLSS